MIAQKPNCNHSMHCTCEERKILLSISVLENFCELLCEFCLKLQLDSFICEASQLSRIFLPTYLNSQTVSLEHKSQSLRKSSHSLREWNWHTCMHMHRCKTKNRGSYPTNTVNALHPDSLICISLMCLFLLSATPLWVSPFFTPNLSVLCKTVYFLIGILRRACSTYREWAFVFEKRERDKSRRKSFEQLW